MGNLRDFFVFLPNVPLIALMGVCFLGQGRMPVEGVALVSYAVIVVGEG